MKVLGSNVCLGIQVVNLWDVVFNLLGECEYVGLSTIDGFFNLQREHLCLL